MELKLFNVAKIESANLKLNGITVIAGNNNTGKSTIGKVVFSLFNSLVNIEEKIVRQKENLIFQFLSRKIEQDVFFDEGIGFSYRVPTPQVRHYARVLNTTESEEGYSELLYSFMSIMSNKGVKKETISEMVDEIKKIKSLPTERLSKSAVSAYFNQVFYSEISSKYRSDEKAIIDATITGKKLRIEFLNNTCENLEQQVNILNEAVYLDNPFVLNYLNTNSYGRNEIEQATIKKLCKRTDAVEDVVQYSFIVDKMQELLNKINEVASGSILTNEAQTYFYKEAGIDKININNLSAGLKSFIIIKRLLEKCALKEKDVLVLDEPEIHLHPAWQLVYAEVIVLLQKTFDLTIVLTTHSAHFLDALNYYAKKYGIAEKCNYYLSSNSQWGCVLQDVTDDLTQIYTQLVDPSILLDKLKYKMEDDDEN